MNEQPGLQPDHWLTDNTEYVDSSSLPLGFDGIASCLLNHNLNDLTKIHSGLLVFPQEQREKLKELCLFTGNQKSIWTTNLMGVVRYENDETKNNLTITIGSRFDSVESQPFFLYLLSQVFDFSLVDWRPYTTPTRLWDFLLVALYKYYLERAYSQGLFKQYVRHTHNNFHCKGTVDLALHLKKNTPFEGRIAYTIREMTYDNPILWLIRYTSDHIKKKYRSLWQSFMTSSPLFGEALRVIGLATPSYTNQKRYHLYYEAKKPIRHSFYLEYDNLRKICLRLLAGEGLNPYQESKGERVYGVLFDGAWLWEQFVFRLLRNLKEFDFNHFIYGHERLFVFADGTYPFYPDYFDKNNLIVLDAKYKNWKLDSNASPDLQQVLSYMFLAKAKRGGVIYPFKETERHNIKHRELNNGVGWWLTIPFPIPESQDSMTFVASMTENINKWSREVRVKLDQVSS